MTHLSPHDALPCSGDLAPVSMLEITHRDADGELVARPLEWKSTLPPPSIVITPEPKKGRSAERDAEPPAGVRSEEHTSELQSLMRSSYAVFCLKKKNNNHEIFR